MDHSGSREKEPDVDIEGGGTTVEDDRKGELWRTQQILDVIRDGPWNPKVAARNENERNIRSDSFERDDLKLVIDKLPREAKRSPEASCKKNTGKPAKPPRPPKGPTLTDADKKLVRELNELATRKRARIERMRASRKIKSAKVYSSSSFSAMIVTVVFFLIIVFQGLFSKSSAAVSSVRSPAPALAVVDQGSTPPSLHDSFLPGQQNNPTHEAFE